MARRRRNRTAPLGQAHQTALSCLHQGRVGEAAAICARVLAQRPRDAHALHLSGIAHLRLGQAQQAVDVLKKAAAVDSGNPDIHSNLGAALRAAGAPARAAKSLRRAIALNPDLAQAHVNLGVALAEQFRHDEAVGSFRKAISLGPARADAHHNLGLTLRAMGKPREAIAAFTTAGEIDPDFAEAIVNRGLAHLALGDLAEGWRCYRMRRLTGPRFAGVVRDPVPADLAGKRVLILYEQGLGDEIFFLRFAEELKERGAWIGYSAQHAVVGMIARLPYIDRVYDTERGEMEPDDVDIRVSVVDLPHVLGIATLDDIPPPLAIPVLAERAAEMRKLLARLGPAPHIGVTWRAGIPESNAHPKSVPVQDFAGALRGMRGTCLALQRRPEDGEIGRLAASLGREVHDLTALNDDLEGMLALLGLIDDYVCVSNTNVHLRAAQGCTSHVLVPNPAPFRWMAAGAESPWFPGTTVYRQATDGDWSAALAALGRDLAHG